MCGLAYRGRTPIVPMHPDTGIFNNCWDRIQ